MLLVPGSLAAKAYNTPAAHYFPPSATAITAPGFNWTAAFGPPSTRNGLWVTPEYSSLYDPAIMETWGLLLDGKDREVRLPRDVWRYTEQ